MMLRIILLIGCAIVLFMYMKSYNKKFLKISLLMLIVPLFFLNTSIQTGRSAIQTYTSKFQDKQMKIDTRTFLYVEVFEDLILNNNLIFGKGANGKYYFSYAEGDDENRLTVEVGVLFYLLKGGIIALILNVLLLIMAIYYAFFRSSNYYIVAIGFVLLVHTILLFIENIPVYSLYNILTWILIGLCASKNFRSLNNQQVTALINLKN